MQRRVMAADLAPSHANGRLCTDKAFLVRQVGVEKTEEDANLRSSVMLDIGRSAETESC